MEDTSTRGFNQIEVQKRLLKALGLDGQYITEIQISLKAQQVAEITVTRILTKEELDNLSEQFETENLDFHPTGETTYNLISRDRGT